MAAFTISSIDAAILCSAEDGATIDDVLALLAEHRREWAGRDIVWDLTRMDFDEIGPADVRRFLVRGREEGLLRSSGRAALVGPDDLRYGMLRMLAVLAESESSLDLRVFRDPAAARRWLAGVRD